MTFQQILIEEAHKRGIPKERIASALKRAALNLGPDGSSRELPAGEVEKARKTVNELMDMVKKMSPEARLVARAILHTRAASRAKNN